MRMPRLPKRGAVAIASRQGRLLAAYQLVMRFVDDILSARHRDGQRRTSGIMSIMKLLLYAALLVANATSPAAAQLKLPRLFSDHTVLQRDRPLRVWARADANAG